MKGGCGLFSEAVGGQWSKAMPRLSQFGEIDKYHRHFEVRLFFTDFWTMYLESEILTVSGLNSFNFSKFSLVKAWGFKFLRNCGEIWAKTNVWQAKLSKNWMVLDLKPSSWAKISLLHSSKVGERKPDLKMSMIFVKTTKNHPKPRNKPKIAEIPPGETTKKSPKTTESTQNHPKATKLRPVMQCCSLDCGEMWRKRSLKSEKSLLPHYLARCWTESSIVLSLIQPPFRKRRHPSVCISTM